MAYMRVTHTQFDPARYDEVMQVAADLGAAVKQLPGAQHVHGGGDRATGKGIGVSIFDTLEHAQFARDVIAGLIPRMQAAGVTAAAPEFYEVIA